MLLGNYSVLNKNPGRSFGGSTVADTRPNFGKSGPARGRFYGVGDLAFDEQNATPNGYTPPYSWVIAQVSGGMASYTIISGSGVVSAANLAGGLNGVAALAGTSSFTAGLQLIVSATAALTGSGAVTGPLVGVLNAAATLTGAGAFTGSLQALASVVATLTGTGALTVTPRATGDMEADITPFTELSPANMAAAVWNAVAAEYTTPGSFGDAARFLYALGHNKVITNPATGKFTVYDDDDVTPLFTADLWEDAAAAGAYDGQGAERRDRFT